MAEDTPQLLAVSTVELDLFVVCRKGGMTLGEGLLAVEGIPTES